MRFLIWTRDCVMNKMDHLLMFLSDNYFYIFCNEPKTCNRLDCNGVKLVEE